MAYKIYLYDTDTDCIGSGCLSSAYMQMMLEYAGGQDVEVHISSQGGSPFDAIAIYDMIKKYQGKVTTYVDSLAASAASIVAMAGQTVVMGKYALLMIHKPMVGTGGNADELMKDIDMLNIVQSRLAQIYIDKTKLDEVTINSLINAVTWLNADQALDLGFIDMIEDYAVENEAKSVTNLAMMKKYSEAAPVAYQRVINKLTIKEPAPTPQTETPMTTEEKAALKAENEGFFKKILNYFKPSIKKVTTDKGDKFVLNALAVGSPVFNDADMGSEAEDAADMVITNEVGKKVKMSIEAGKVSNLKDDEDEDCDKDDDEIDKDCDEDDEIDADNKVVLNTIGIDFKKSLGSKVVKNAMASKLKEISNKAAQQDAIILDLNRQLKVANDAVIKERIEIKNEIQSEFTPQGSKRSSKAQTETAPVVEPKTERGKNAVKQAMAAAGLKD